MLPQSSPEWSPSTVRAFAVELPYIVSQLIIAIEDSHPYDAMTSLDIIHWHWKLQQAFEQVTDCVEAIEDTLYLSDSDDADIY
jgi:hypothetical protein